MSQISILDPSKGLYSSFSKKKSNSLYPITYIPSLVAVLLTSTVLRYTGDYTQSLVGSGSAPTNYWGTGDFESAMVAFICCFKIMLLLFF